MRTSSLVLIILALLYSTQCSPSVDKKRKLAAQTAEELQARLLTTLTKTIAEKGPAGAIGVCHTLSPETEKELSSRGVTVRRISDRTRNPAHKPDELEARVLSDWRAAMNEGREIQPHEQMTPEGFRFIKPIKIANEACLHCHGDPASMKPDVKAAIAKLYPGDRAVGYKMGELRGAISILVK